MSRPWPESLVGQVLTIRGATHLCLAAGEDTLLLLQLARCDGALFRSGDPVQYIVAHGACLHGDELVWRQGAYYPLLGYENELPYARAAALMEEYNSFPVKRGAQSDVEPLNAGCSEAKLRAWLRQMRAAGTRERTDAARQEEFLALYKQCQQVVAALYQDDEYSSDSNREWKPEDVKPADIERVLCDGIPRTGSGNLQKMSQSLLNRQFQQRRLTRQRLDSLLKGELQIERFDLITLGFLAASQREDDDPPERLRRYMDDMNAGLARCGMMKLYPVNPYEAFCMMCLLCDMPLLTYYDVWEMSFEEA